MADALQLLQWELHGATLNILQQLAVSAATAVGTPNGEKTSVSEKGVLQLLFDQRLLRDVLGAGRPLGATAGVTIAEVGATGVAAALSARKQLVTTVERLLQVGPACIPGGQAGNFRYAVVPEIRRC